MIKKQIFGKKNNGPNPADFKLTGSVYPGEMVRFFPSLSFIIFRSETIRLKKNYLIFFIEVNLSKQNGDVNADVTTEIDLNELFKSGNAPRFLQFELYKDFKPPVFTICDKLYIESPLASSAYSKSKSRRNFAAHLAKLVFTPRERLESNCNGRFGKKALDTLLLNSIKNTLFQFYPCRQSTNDDSIASGGCDENNVWLRDCIPAIDESNRVLKKQLIAW